MNLLGISTTRVLPTSRSPWQPNERQAAALGHSLAGVCVDVGLPYPPRRAPPPGELPISQSVVRYCQQLDTGLGVCSTLGQCPGVSLQSLSYCNNPGFSLGREIAFQIIFLSFISLFKLNFIMDQLLEEGYLGQTSSAFRRLHPHSCVWPLLPRWTYSMFTAASKINQKGKNLSYLLGY